MSDINWRFWLAFALFLVVWEVAALHMSNSLVIVPLQAIVRRAVVLWQQQQLQQDITTSAIEFVLGYAIAALGGVITGTVAGYWARAGQVIDPFVNAAYATPVIALGPLFIIVLGIGVWSKVGIVAMAAVFPIILNTSAGIRATEKGLLELGYAFRLTPLKVLWEISLPSSLPFVFAGLAIAVGRGLTAIVAGELFGARAGLGLRLLTSASNFDTAGIFVVAAILAISGILLTELVRLVQNWVMPWRQ